jgi:hypothetical protein
VRYLIQVKFRDGAENALFLTVGGQPVLVEECDLRAKRLADLRAGTGDVGDFATYVSQDRWRIDWITTREVGEPVDVTHEPIRKLAWVGLGDDPHDVLTVDAGRLPDGTVVYVCMWREVGMRDDPFLLILDDGCLRRSDGQEVANYGFKDQR